MLTTAILYSIISIAPAAAYCERQADQLPEACIVEFTRSRFIYNRSPGVELNIADVRGLKYWTGDCTEFAITLSTMLIESGLVEREEITYKQFYNSDQKDKHIMVYFSGWYADQDGLRRAPEKKYSYLKTYNLDRVEINVIP